MANLTITNATVLQVSAQPVTFESDFRFGTRKNISVEVASIDSLNVDGVGLCAETADDLRKTKNWEGISINGEDFGRGKLVDFSLEEGTWVTYTKATLAVEIYEEGDLESLKGDYYKGLQALKDSGEYLDDFSEDFTFTRATDSTTYNYNLTLKFSQAAQLFSNNGCVPGEVAQALECAREIIKGEVGARPAFALIDDEVKALYSTYGKGKKRLLREATDAINSTCSFTEEFTAYNIEELTYSSIIRQDISLGEDGIVDIRENGTLLGLDVVDDDEIQRQIPAMGGEIAEAISPTGRLVDMFNFYKLQWECPDIHDLVLDEDGNLLVIQKGRVFDTFKGEAKYDITVTNNPKYEELVIHEYTITTEAIKGQKGGLYQATEQGTLTGKTKGEVTVDTDEDGSVSWNKVREYWQSILGADGFVIPKPPDPNTPRIKSILRAPLVSPRLVSNSTTWSPWKVQIGYRQVVSEAPQFRENDGLAKSITLKESKSYSTQKHKVGNVINAKKQILQRRETASRDGINGQLDIIGKRHATLDGLLELGKEKFDDADYWPNSMNPQDFMTYLEGCAYSFADDNDIKLNINVGWK